ncbi:MAG TPA: dihydrofolate reductase family protein [Actinomycetes bacterium]|nr:dihydrofolate reductase family protein [Actinomycetes bacterium]
MRQVMVDFIISLDGYASAEGWPGLWGMGGPEYLRWLDEAPERDHTLLMGANTYRLMWGFAAADAEGVGQLTDVDKVVFSSTLDEPLEWANSRLVRDDAVAVVTEMKRSAEKPMRTLGSLTLCRALLKAGLVDRYRVVVFPVITGSTGRQRIFDGYPDVMLEMVDHRTFDGRLQLLEYVPKVLDAPPGAA